MLAEVYCHNNEEKAFLVKTEGENICFVCFSTKVSGYNHLICQKRQVWKRSAEF